MARIQPIEINQALPKARKVLQREELLHGRVTNMKRTLGRSPAALHALLEWYPLHREIQKFLGKRGAILFAHAISTGSECLLCSIFMRRVLIEWGENPNELVLDEQEQLLVEFGQRLGDDPNTISDALFDRLKQIYTADQIVTLTAFAGLMIATNVFNNALRVDLDEYLHPFIPPQSPVSAEPIEAEEVVV